MTEKLTIIIPCLDSADRILPTLECLVEPTVSGLIKQVIIADGGSIDATNDLAEQVGADFISCPKGRGIQCKIATIYAKANWLLFIHDDSILSDEWDRIVSQFINDETHNHHIGYFKHQLNSTSIKAKLLSFSVYLRCKIFTLPYGDQGLLIHRDTYEEIGGFSSKPIMEDVELIARIKRQFGRKSLVMLNSTIKTSDDKYRNGYLKRIFRNFSYLMAYKFGKDPKAIAKAYYK